MSSNQTDNKSSYLDEEFAYQSTPNPTGSPERRLALAVLERAILDYVGNCSQEVQDAEEWLFSRKDSSTAFTFAWVCHTLDLDQSYILEKITQMPKRGERRIAPWYFTKGKAANIQEKRIRLKAA